MKMNSFRDKEAVYLPRTEKHSHVVIDENMHHALKLYASKHGITLASATARLIRLGLMYELAGL